MPRRHQRPPRHRLKGWTKPKGARMVTRPYRWSNPHPIDEPCPVGRCAGTVHNRPDCVASFETDLLAGRLRTYRKGRPVDEPHGITELRAELAGLDVVCACEPDELCHGDVILTWANPPETETP